MSDDTPATPPAPRGRSRDRFQRDAHTLVGMTRDASDQIRRTRPAGVPFVLQVGLPDPEALADDLRARADALEDAAIRQRLRTGELAEARGTLRRSAPAMREWAKETRRWLDLLAASPVPETAAAARLALGALGACPPRAAELTQQLHRTLPLLQRAELAEGLSTAWGAHLHLGADLLCAAQQRQAAIDDALLARTVATITAPKEAHMAWLRDLDRRWTLAVRRSGGLLLPLWWDGDPANG